MEKLPFLAAVEQALEKTLFTNSTEKENAVTRVFMDWLNNDARLKSVPDLQQRIVDMEPKLRNMAKNLTLSFQGGRVVIKTDAESESLLNLFRRGSDWFDPHPDVNAAILMGLAQGS